MSGIDASLFSALAVDSGRTDHYIFPSFVSSLPVVLKQKKRVLFVNANVFFLKYFSFVVSRAGQMFIGNAENS